MLYLFPVIFAVSGVNFPVGVLIYWSTTNLWTWGQQYYVIKRNPTPGSPAFEELQKKKAEKLGMTVAEMEAMNDPKKAKSVNGQGSGSEGETPKQEGQRTQPTKNKKKKKKK
jgi:YidC/Oxa1 family membrane protein insertase